MTNEFWTFSLSLYAADGVAPACVTVQDELGLDVNVILYACWLASQGRQLTPGHLTGLESCIAGWRGAVVQPLRQLRRALRDYAPASAVREGIKALELQSEQQQQDMMWRYYNAAEALSRVPGPLLGNLTLLFGEDDQNSDAWRALVDAISLHIST